jgi:hypothetical protein
MSATDVLGRLREDVGRDRRGASSWTFPAGAVDVRWYLERGRVAERLGDRARATGAYRYVPAAWRRPDPELEPYAARGQERAGAAHGGAQTVRPDA